jgi:hypothetical protein
VRPEDLAHYTAAGINIFKIQGRGAKPENLLRTITMYMAGGLPARFVPISLFASGRSGFTLDNQALEGFLDFFVNHPYRCHLGCEDCHHCYDWAERAVIVDEDAVQQVMAAAETLRKDSLTFHRRVDEFGEMLLAGPLADFFSQPA